MLKKALKDDGDLKCSDSSDCYVCEYRDASRLLILVNEDDGLLERPPRPGSGA